MNTETGTRLSIQYENSQHFYFKKSILGINFWRFVLFLLSPKALKDMGVTTVVKFLSFQCLLHHSVHHI